MRFLKKARFQKCPFSGELPLRLHALTERNLFYFFFLCSLRCSLCYVHTCAGFVVWLCAQQIVSHLNPIYLLIHVLGASLDRSVCALPNAAIKLELPVIKYQTKMQNFLLRIYCVLTDKAIDLSSNSFRAVFHAHYSVSQPCCRMYTLQ